MVDHEVLKIERAIKELQKSENASGLNDILLRGALNWRFNVEEKRHGMNFEDLLSASTVHNVELGYCNEDYPVKIQQLILHPKWPYRIFIIGFGSSKIFKDGRRMTILLRELEKGLIERSEPPFEHPSRKKKHTIFLCHSGTEFFQFARFEEQEGDVKKSKFVKFGWGPNDNIKTVCEYHLKYFIYKDEMNEEEVESCIDSAFNLLQVSNHFIDDYKNEIELAKPFIAKNSDLSIENDIHHATQLLFNRILFLRFIEKKGWLEFSQTDDYLKELLQAHDSDSEQSFYSSRLRRLFFEGLANEGKGENPAYGFVPFLNIELFEESEQDKSIVDLPDELFHRLLGPEGLFYRWNFTPYESTPYEIELAVDPEMIGRLFEELVTSRHEKGAYYTPRPIVAFMCREAIKSVILNKTNVDSETICQLIDNHNEDGLSSEDAKIIHHVLNDITAVDPACGSGAYLLGLLHELVQIYNLLSKVSEDLVESQYDMKIRIIRNSIFGVDMDKFATIQAQLRLWLSISIDASGPEIMPNLDMNIVAGDSLLKGEPNWIKTSRPLDFVGNRARAEKMSKIRKQYISSYGVQKYQLLQDWHALEREINAMKGNDIENQSIDFGATFYDVFDRDNGGFDIVLANPPYVRQEDINKIFKDAAIRNFPKLVSGKSDLYIYFYARAKQLLRKGGVSCFICSNTWLDVEFGAPLQEDIIKNFNDIRIIDFRKQRIFESAEVNTIISIMVKDASIDLMDEMSFIMFEDSFENSISNSILRTEIKITKRELLSRGTDIRNNYVGYKWSLILRAPDIYHQLMKNHAEKFLTLSVLCQRTQRNNMELLPKDFEVVAQSAEGVKDRAPFLHSFKDVNGIKPDLSNQKSIIHPKARLLMSDGNFRRADIISTRFYGERIFFIQGGDFFVNDSFFIGQLHGNYHLKNTILALNSTLSLLFVELRGRKGQGGGVLSFYGPEFNGHQIINPSLLDGIEDGIYHSMTKRAIGTVFEECGFDSEMPLREQKPSPLPDRKAVDDFIFDILGLGQEDRNEVYWYLCESVQNRGTRSKSI